MKKKISIFVCFILIFAMNTHVQVAFAREKTVVEKNTLCYFGYGNNVSHTFAVVDITELSIRELQQAVDEGFLTYEQIMRLYLERIEAYGEMYQCITQISETALEEAIACDRIYKEQGRSSLLFGLPAIVKDNLDVAGMATTDGNAFLETKLATTDADVIASLKNAGAIIVARANDDATAIMAAYCFEQARGLHLKTPLAPNLYEIPDNIVALYKLAEQEIYPPIDQYDHGDSEEYEQVMRAYQAVLDFLDSSYYDDEQANSVANELLMDYYDAVMDYRFSYLRESRSNIKLRLQGFAVDNFVKGFLDHLATL